MNRNPHAHNTTGEIPAALGDEDLDRVAGGVDPTNPNVVYVGGSTRSGTGGHTGGLIGIDFRPN